MSVVKMEKIKELAKIIADNYMPYKIILFGSYARGTATEDSDIDILVVKDSDKTHNRRSAEVYKYFRRMLFDIDILVYTQKEIEEWKNVKQAFITTIINEGKVLYEKI